MRQSTERLVSYIRYSDLVLVRILAYPYYGREMESGVLLNERFFLEHKKEIEEALMDFSFGESAGKHSLVRPDKIESIKIDETNIGSFVESVLDSPEIIQDYLYFLPNYKREVSDGELVSELIQKVRFITVPEDFVITT